MTDVATRITDRALGINTGATTVRRQIIIWGLCCALAIALPWFFYDYVKGRHAGFEVKMFSQMGLMLIFSLSFNMQMGQAGLLSFGHAVFFGLGGYVTAHTLNAIGDGGFWLPIELVPLAGGVGGLVFAIVLGWLITKQRATAFAMITLGIGELVTACAVMFIGFFGGEGGVTTNRVIKTSPLGLTYGADIQVYYLIIGWAIVATLAMYLLTRTPLGRMANACRDNFERAQFVGYDPRMVRFYQFALSGFFAGIGGALYAISYEIVTFDAVAGVTSGNALLMTFIGGVGVFYGPIVGTILIVFLQTKVSLMSSAWPIYIGVLFIIMVMFAPGGIAGLMQMHAPLVRARLLHRLAMPYLRILVPGLAATVGFIALVELYSFVSTGKAQGRTLALFGQPITGETPIPWAIAGALLVLGLAGLRWQGRFFRQSWDALMEESKAVRHG